MRPAAAAAEMEAAWYESVHYFLSLHPSSARLPETALPQEVPKATRDGHHMVSELRPLELRPAGPRQESTVCKGVHYNERLSIRTDRLDTHAMLYLWCRKASAFRAEETFLLGCRAVPLRDRSLHGRLAAWDVSAVESGEEIAEVRLRLSVGSVPGPIQLPHLDDVRPTKLRLNWSLPVEVNGLPVLGYRIALLPPFAEEWTVVCECTAATSFKVDRLAASTVYRVDIRAINAAGMGEPVELEATTGQDDSDALAGEEDEFDDLQSGNENALEAGKDRLGDEHDPLHAHVKTRSRVT